jgi:hypothetical protein
VGVYLGTFRRNVFTTKRYAAQECPFYVGLLQFVIGRAGDASKPTPK